VIMLLWSRLGQFMHDNRLRWIIGCASMPMSDGGACAASWWRCLSSRHACPDRVVTPRRPLPLERLPQHLEIEPPPLIRSWLRCGATVLGAPAWDAAFGTAAMPMLLDVQAMSQRHQLHFTRD
jgi:putative hemolysin